MELQRGCRAERDTLARQLGEITDLHRPFRIAPGDLSRATADLRVVRRPPVLIREVSFASEGLHFQAGPKVPFGTMHLVRARVLALHIGDKKRESWMQVSLRLPRDTPA